MSDRITVACGGAVETAFLPARLLDLRVRYGLEVYTACSARALDFVTPTALRAVTTHAPVLPETRWAEDGTPAHLSLAATDLVVVFPATARILAEGAIGSITCPVTRLIAFTPWERLVIAPAIPPALDPTVYRPHLQTLRDRGCTVLGSDDLFASWRDVLDHLQQRLGLVAAPQPDSPLALFRTQSDES